MYMEQQGQSQEERHVHFSQRPQGAAQDKTDRNFTHPQGEIHIAHRPIFHTLWPAGGKHYLSVFSQCDPELDLCVEQ